MAVKIWYANFDLDGNHNEQQDPMQKTKEGDKEPLEGGVKDSKA